MQAIPGSLEVALRCRCFGLLGVALERGSLILGEDLAEAVHEAPHDGGRAGAGFMRHDPTLQVAFRSTWRHAMVWAAGGTARMGRQLRTPAGLGFARASWATDPAGRGAARDCRHG